MATTDQDKQAQIRYYLEEVKQKPHSDSHLIGMLHKAQSLYGYLSKEVIDEIAVEMNIPTAHIWGVATFYHYFHLKPQGRHPISVCLGTACYVKGAAQIQETLKQQLKVKVGDTTEDRLFTLLPARCLGACGLAPVVMIDDRIYGELTPQKITEIINKIKRQAKKQ